MEFPNIYTLFRERVAAHTERDVFYVREGEAWRPWSWRRFAEEAEAFGCALIAEGLEPGGAVCILMGNRPEWPVADIGTISAGGVAVGLYPTSSADQCRYIVEHADAKFVLVDTPRQLEKLLGAGLPETVGLVICLDEAAAEGRAGVVSYRRFIERGRRHAPVALPALRRRGEQARASDTAIMVYTSGTTGLPKGACLSHQYVLNSVESLRGTIPIFDSDVTFSYLPFCHVAERISGLYNRLYAGTPAYFVEDVTKLWDYMQEVRPTVFASLPRFFEKVHARVMADLERLPAGEREVFERALGLGREISRLRQARLPVPEHLASQYRLVAGPAAERVKQYFGGRIRLATSGGAPLPLEIQEFFDAFGLPVLQAYGLTENVCVAFNRPDNYKFGTVGPPMPGCEVRIAEDGEILVRSAMMFSGYYKSPEQTAEMFRDGWLLTGDLGEQDAEGFLKITGRKKELLITSTGKNVAPALIENLLKEHHLISHAMLYGEGKSYLTALVTLNPVEAAEYARSRGINEADFAALTRRPEIVRLVEEIVEGVNARLSSTEAIKRFVILDRDLSIDLDEVTPTMKVKREVVARKFGHLLEALYA